MASKLLTTKKADGQTGYLHIQKEHKDITKSKSKANGERKREKKRSKNKRKARVQCDLNLLALILKVVLQWNSTELEEFLLKCEFFFFVFLFEGKCSGIINYGVHNGAKRITFFLFDITKVCCLFLCCVLNEIYLNITTNLIVV